MAVSRWLAAIAICAAAVVASSAAASLPKCFPDDFMFGSATAAYQVEGGYKDGGRTPSIWDDFCRTFPGVMCANEVDDFYHRYKSDVQLMASASPFRGRAS
jgi:beta-glucosidase/6-phospho-beta-glucosidase/beta-galactosidase